MFVQRVKSENPVDDGPSQLQKCREQINSAKHQINREIDREGLRVWDSATSWMELSRPLAISLRGKYDIPVDASNAFFKCIELFNLISPFLKSCGPEIKMFDNASLPGDFIRAAKWWAAPQKIDWRANSLIGGLDDRFRLMKSNPARWMMNAHMNGDVTVETNRSDIIHQLGEWRADIYTSDLGFAVESYFHEEEEHFQAHQAQCYLGTQMLRLGGAMIVKTFTMSTANTISLVNYLMDGFNEFYIVKPATSKPDNSECYWVCLGYRGSSSSANTIYPQALIQAQQLLAKRQAQKITQNVCAFRRYRQQRPNFELDIKRWCVQHIDVHTQHRSASMPTPQLKQ